MTIQALGYVGVRAEGVEDWSKYASGLLGLQTVDKSRATRAFRMDDRKQRIVVDGTGGQGIAFFGWGVADAAALDAGAAQLQTAGTKVARRPRGPPRERPVQEHGAFN